MSEEITFDDIEFGEPIEEREPNYRDGYIRGIYRARNIIDSKQKEIERLKIIEEKYKDSQLYIHDFKEEIEKLNNIINKVKQQLLNKKDIVEKSKYFKLVYYTDWNMEHEWDKSIVDKIDEIINIIDEENK